MKMTSENQNNHPQHDDDEAVRNLVGDILTKRHYRFFLISLLLHLIIYGLLHMSFDAKDLIQLFLADILMLVVACIGSAKRLPLLIIPTIIIKFMLFSASVLLSLMCLSNMNINEKSKEARMQFRRQRSYPEVVNILLEDHPSVCIWIYGVVTLLCLDMSNSIKALTESTDLCLKKHSKKEMPPSYSVCVTSASNVTLPPTYFEAMKLRDNYSAVIPTHHNHVSILMHHDRNTKVIPIDIPEINP